MKKFFAISIFIFIGFIRPVYGAGVDTLFNDLGGAIGVFIEQLNKLEVFERTLKGTESAYRLFQDAQESGDLNVEIDALIDIEEWGEKHKVFTPLDKELLSRDQITLKTIFEGWKMPDDVELEGQLAIEDARLKVNQKISQLETMRGSMSRRDFLRLTAIKGQVAALDKRASLSLPQIFPKGINVAEIIADKAVAAMEQLNYEKYENRIPTPATAKNRSALTNALFPEQKPPSLGVVKDGTRNFLPIDSSNPFNKVGGLPSEEALINRLKPAQISSNPSIPSAPALSLSPYSNPEAAKIASFAKGAGKVAGVVGAVTTAYDLAVENNSEYALTKYMESMKACQTLQSQSVWAAFWGRVKQAGVTIGINTGMDDIAALLLDGITKGNFSEDVKKELQNGIDSIKKNCPEILATLKADPRFVDGLQDMSVRTAANPQQLELGQAPANWWMPQPAPAVSPYDRSGPAGGGFKYK